MHSLSAFVFALFALAGQSVADCVSYGYDYVDGGGPYCINTTSTAYFSFGTEFFGCQPSDVQDNAVTPILIDPNGAEYFCSDIAVQPDGEDMVSTCNVPQNELTKNNMLSGTWTAIMEGLTFAYMRSFSIIAAPPVTVTSTPTVIFTVTSTPSTTITTTIVNVFSTTASASTITVPTTTSTRTITTTPAQVTVYWTSTITRTRATRVFSKAISTTTVTTSCKTQPPAKDPTCTIHPTKATLAASSETMTIVPRVRQYPGSGFQWSGRGGWGGHKRAMLRRDNGTLVDAGPDMCTTTIVDTADAVSSYTTVTASTTTEIDTENATTTTTVTPPPVTAYSGKAKTTITVTASTPTYTHTTRTSTTVWTTSTVWATITSIVKTSPSGWVCATSAGN